MQIRHDNDRRLINSGFAVSLCFNYGIPLLENEIMFSGEPVRLENSQTLCLIVKARKLLLLRKTRKCRLYLPTLAKFTLEMI